MSKSDTVNINDYILFAHPTPNAPSPPSHVSTLADLLEHQANVRKDATLFSFHGDNVNDDALRSISYVDAYQTSVSMANALLSSLDRRTHNCASQAPVFGIWLEKSLDLHFAIFATTCAGATWLPFDPDAPAERVQVCLSDSNASILLCDKEHLQRAKDATSKNEHVQVVLVDDLRSSAVEETAKRHVERLRRGCSSDTAYMIYTSGSTGTPKGIAIPHCAALTFALSEQTVLGTCETDVVWQGFSPAFDMFIEEVWVSIVGGAQLVVGSRAECQNVTDLGGAQGVWARRGITLVNCVPTLINIMTSLDDEHDGGLPKSVRLLNVGGEACPPALVQRLWRPNVRIINTYGPSETTVTATFQELFPDEQVTIGKPLPSYHAIVLPVQDDDDDGANVGTKSPLAIEPGIEGELAIGGACLGKGYVGRAELTAEKFIVHPFYPDQRLYRTGDRVRLTKDLNIAFLGRIDTQVKHRGFRIELGEIENALCSHRDVQTVSVILSSAASRLEAYVVVKEQGGSLDQSELRQTLSCLPAYMQPEAYFFLRSDEMPRLPSGKINAKALQTVSEVRLQQEYKQSTSNETDVEDEDDLKAKYAGASEEMITLLSTLRQVFPQAQKITPLSDFFDDLGGHSLAAAIFVSNVRKQSASTSTLRSIGLQDIYVCRTVKALAEKFEVSHAKSVDSERKPSSDFEKGSQATYDAGAGPNGVLTGDVWPVSARRFYMCGLAQLAALLFIWFLQSIQFLVPYLIFVCVQIETGSLGWSLLATYGTFVVTPVFLLFVALFGKWLIIGRTRAGEYPLYGVYYYRWWFASRLVGMVDLATLAETPLIPMLWRLMGARVGKHCHLGHVNSTSIDMIEIGDDVVVSNAVSLSTAYVERGRLIIKPVKIGSGVYVGANCVIEGGAVVEDDAELVRLTMVPDGRRIPQAQRWHGSPAQYLDDAPNVGLESRTRPSLIRRLLTSLTISLLSVFVLPIVYLAPQVPILILFEYLNVPKLSHLWTQIAVLAIPAAMAYVTLVFVEMVALRWLVLGRMKEGVYRNTSLFFIRKWFVDRIMAISLIVLHAVYATLYVIPFLRALGVKIGSRAEVSNASGINFNLTEIGDESFVADQVYIGPIEMRGNAITMRKTTFAKRAFAGNSSIVPQGATLQSDTLVGVMSTAPDPDREKQMQTGQSCFGSPPVMMPARQAACVNHAAHLLFSPRMSQVALRLFIEGMRILLPRAMIVLSIGFSMSIFQVAYPHIGVVYAGLMLPLYHFVMFCLPSLAVIILCKWTMIGRYKKTEWPLWSHQVWRSEFVTSTYESLVAPTLTNQLVGTPFLAICFRLLGVKIGSRVTLLHNDITEYDMVTLGDESVINVNAGAQTHLFEDRVMKIGPVVIGQRATVKTYSTCLPNSQVSDYAQVGALSLVMKGETVLANEAWEGAPIQPRKSLRRTPFNVTPSATPSSPTLSSAPTASNTSVSPIRHIFLTASAYTSSNSLHGSLVDENERASSAEQLVHPFWFARPRGTGSRASSRTLVARNGLTSHSFLNSA